MEITKDQKGRSVRESDVVFEGPASTCFQLEQGQGHIQTKGLGRGDVAHGWLWVQEDTGEGFEGGWGGGRRAQRRGYTSYRRRVAWRLKLDQGRRRIPRFVLKSVAAGGGRKR